jgi:hyperosmotically inducible protein
MHLSKTLGAVIVAAVAIGAAPASVMSQTTTDKMESKVKSAAHEVGTGLSDSWLTAKTKIALFADERVSAPQVSVETKNGMVTLRGEVDSSESRAAAVEIATATDGVRATRASAMSSGASPPIPKKRGSTRWRSTVSLISDDERSLDRILRILRADLDLRHVAQVEPGRIDSRERVSLG